MAAYVVTEVCNILQEYIHMWYIDRWGIGKTRRSKVQGTRYRYKIEGIR